VIHALHSEAQSAVNNLAIPINSIEKAQHFATQLVWTYNNNRPNMGIGGIAPAMKLKMAA
jgi:hypothetical protein